MSVKSIVQKRKAFLKMVRLFMCDAWKWLTQLRIYIRFRKAPTRS